MNSMINIGLDEYNEFREYKGIAFL